jgi:lipoprotein signal peptidase
MVPLFVVSFAVSVGVSLLIVSQAPQLVVETERWFGVVPYPYSGLLAVLALAFVALAAGDARRPLALALGGALANLSWYFFGGRTVADYIPLGFAVGNVADLFIVAGLVWAAVLLVKQKNSP